jgi:phosphatidylserine/phosphatidylglycerophosphate/cardiolipin synthase-like enzyme
MLAGARRKVFVASLLVGDPAVRTALLDAAERLGGGVYVVAALHDKGFDRLITRVDCDPVDSTQPPLSELTRAGVAVRGYPGCHAKFVVVDDEVALVSSGNLVFSEAGENGVVVTGEDRVAPLSRLFARLWQLSPWDVPPDRDAYTVLSRERSPEPAAVEPPAPDAAGPVWTWGPDRHLLQAVRELVDSATEDLVLATDGVREMAAKPDLLLDKVRTAVERGVRVRLLIRARNDDRPQRTAAIAFAKAGAEVHADPLHRAKAVIADGSRGLLGSANLAGTPGLTGGVEVAMRLDGAPALAEALRYLEHVMAEAPTRFVQDATVDQLAAGLGTSALSPWPLPSKLSVVAEEEDWKRLVNAAARGGPALFSADEEGPMLHVGVGRWRIHTEDGGHRLELTEYGTSVQRASEVLDGWLADAGSLAANVDSQAGAERRGLCPAVLVRRTASQVPTGDAESGHRDLAG